MENKIRKLIEEDVQKMGISIDSIVYEKEGSNYFLRSVIDRDEAIDIDTCVEVTNVINPLLASASGRVYTFSSTTTTVQAGQTIPFEQKLMIDTTDINAIPDIR